MFGSYSDDMYGNDGCIAENGGNDVDVLTPCVPSIG